MQASSREPTSRQRRVTDSRVWPLLGWGLLLAVIVLLVALAASVVERARPLRDRRFWIGRFQHQHTELLRIMDATHATLARHRIVYWLHGGSLLGAVRHGAFVDWDDDIDIAVLVDTSGKLEKGGKPGKPTKTAASNRESDDSFWSRWEAFATDMKKQGFTVTTRRDAFVSAAQISGAKYGSLHHIDAIFHMGTRTHCKPLTSPPTAAIKYEPNWLLRLVAPQEYFGANEVWPLRAYEFAGRQYAGPRDPWPFLTRAYPGFDRGGRLHWPHSWSPAQIPHLTPVGLLAAALVPTYPLTRIECLRLDRFRGRHPRDNLSQARTPLSDGQSHDSLPLPKKQHRAMHNLSRAGSPSLGSFSFESGLLDSQVERAKECETTIAPSLAPAYCL